MIRRLGLLSAGTALLAACSGPAPAAARLPATPTESPTSTASTAVACPEAGIGITAGEVDTALGLRALGIILVNCGTRDYTASGYPAVRVLDADRKPLEVPVGNGSMPISAPDSYDVKPVPGDAATRRPGDGAGAVAQHRDGLDGGGDEGPVS